MRKVRIPYPEPVEFKMTLNDPDPELALPRFYTADSIRGAFGKHNPERIAILGLAVGQTYTDNDGDTWTRIEPTTTPED